MTRTPNGWDRRDYILWSAIRQLPSYGLIGRDSDNPMLSRKEVLALLEKHAEDRFDVVHQPPAKGADDKTVPGEGEGR